jgi:hypothetical protein
LDVATLWKVEVLGVLEIRECDGSQPGVLRKVTQHHITKIQTFTKTVGTRAGRRSSVGCDGTRSWLRKIGPEAMPGVLRSKTQFAATQMEAANEGGKVKTSAARGHHPTHGKQTRAECKITDTIMCHAGSKDQHHWYAASARLCQRLRSLYSSRCDWLSGETGSHWLAHEVECAVLL